MDFARAAQVLFFLGVVLRSCHGEIYTLHGSSGNITSPNYPANYPNSANEKWLIQAPSGTTFIKFTFLDMEIQDHSTCKYDYMGIYSSTVGSRGSHIYCGFNLFSPVIIQGKYATVYFRSSSSPNYPGFKLEWKVTTASSLYPSNGGYTFLTATSGNITSPNFPSNYVNSYKHHWKIIAPTGIVTITLTFTDFHTQNCGDYVKIYNSNPVSSASHVTRCGSRLPGPIYVNGRYAIIYFYTDSSTSYKGFNIQWTVSSSVVPPKDGITDLAGSLGTITSPYYPFAYVNSYRHTWKITAPSGTNSIRFTFTSFVTEDCTDYLQIYVSHSASSSFKTQCGSTIPSPFNVPGRYAMVFFYTDSNRAYRGFLLNWAASNTTVAVNAGTTNYTGSSGTITSPYYPLTYPNNYRHTWQITAPSDTGYILFTFSSFRTEQCEDYIRVYGSHSTSSTNTRKCGTPSVISPITTSGRYAMVYFYTDGNTVDSGFRIQWTAYVGTTSIVTTVPPSSGTTYLSGSSGAITSPNYPSNYINNYRHTWEITAPPNTPNITFAFSYFDTETCGDYVQIFKSHSTPTSAIRQCGSAIPSPITTQGRLATVYFKTDSSKARKGFRLTWTSVPPASTSGSRDVKTTNALLFSLMLIGFKFIMK